MSKTVKELHEERSVLYNVSIDNHKNYIDKETNLFKDEFVEHRVCPVCNCDDTIKIFTKEGGTYVKCKNCEMVYINPVFTDEALTDYYTNNHDLQAKIVQNDMEFYISIYQQGIDAVEKQNFCSRNLLDVGCSSGVFLDLAKKNDWITHGVELNTKEAEYAASKQHEVYTELLENITFNKKFDLITMWDVFEHLKDGEFYLKHMKSLLNKKGVVFLQIPSSDSLATKILREKCNMFDGLEHVNLYGLETITKLANKCGLKVLSTKTVISEVGVINNYLNYEDPYLGNTQNKENIPNVITEEEVLETLQGYKIQIVLGDMNDYM